MKIYNLIKLIFINTFIFLILLLLIDNLIFYSAENLPKEFIKYLSYKSQVKYRLNNIEESSHIYEDYIYYLKPNSSTISMSDGKPFTEHSDEFGYSNPPNYLNTEQIEVLLIGDSSTQAPNLTNGIRNHFDGKVYSLGIGGQGIFHWKHQYRRFKKIYSDFSNPKIILLLYDENDIGDTLRALKYQRAGYKNSIYYPANPIHDKLYKINREYSFYHEIYSLIRYFVSSTQIREKLKTFLEDKNLLKKNLKDKLIKAKILPKQHSSGFMFLNYNENCKIRMVNAEPNKNFFSETTTAEIVKQIEELLKLINFDETKVFFSYNPPVNSTYNKKFTENDLMKEFAEMQIKSSSNFEQYFNKNQVNYIDVVPKIRTIAKNESLHPCNGKDSHLSKYGYRVYATLVSDEVKKILKEN